MTTTDSPRRWRNRHGNTVYWSDLEDMLADSVDDQHPDGVTVAGVRLPASRALREADPTAWRQLLLDMVDRLERDGHITAVDQ